MPTALAEARGQLAIAAETEAPSSSKALLAAEAYALVSIAESLETLARVGTALLKVAQAAVDEWDRNERYRRDRDGS